MHSRKHTFAPTCTNTRARTHAQMHTHNQIHTDRHSETGTQQQRTHSYTLNSRSRRHRGHTHITFYSVGTTDQRKRCLRLSICEPAPRSDLQCRTFGTRDRWHIIQSHSSETRMQLPTLLQQWSNAHTHATHTLTSAMTVPTPRWGNCLTTGCCVSSGTCRACTTGAIARRLSRTQAREAAYPQCKDGPHN
jgi:hypothetical protein